MFSHEIQPIAGSVKTELIVTLSWEPRFLLGLKHVAETERPNACSILVYSEWEHQCGSNLSQALELLASLDIHDCQTVTLSYKSPETNLDVLRRLVSRQLDRVIIDISTQPRETTLILFHLLDLALVRCDYVYHTPSKYGDWLTRDPDRPRLVAKLGGEVHLGRSTLLLILTGFDVERTEQLLLSFEPQHLILGFPIGSQFDNQIRNKAAHFSSSILRGENRFEFDSYDIEATFAVLREIVKPHLPEFNIVAVSLGPKLSTIPLFMLHRLYPQIGLAYAPAGEFNPLASFGRDRTQSGSVSKLLEWAKPQA